MSFEWQEDWSFWAHCQAGVAGAPQGACRQSGDICWAFGGFLETNQPQNVEKLSLTACLLCIQCFMEQNEMSWCKKTHEAQLNKGNGSVIKKFVQHIQWKKIMLGITDDKTIANADKNAHFSPSFEHAIADRGSRTIAIPQPISSKHCAAMLGCAMNSDKLPPYIIFQGETPQVVALLISHKMLETMAINKVQCVVCNKKHDG